MSKTTEETVVHRNSKDRLDTLEKQVVALTQSVNALVDANQTLTLQVANLGHSLGLVSNRSSTVRAELAALVQIIAENKPITLENIKEKVVSATVESLKSDVEKLVQEKILMPTEDVADDSYVVGKQVMDGKVVNERIQFLLSSLDQDMQMKILSKKAGETVIFGEGQPDLYIMEVYKDVTSLEEQP